MFELFPIKNSLENVEGFYFQGVSMGLKKDGAQDLAFIRSDDEVDVEAIFTANKFQAAPLKHYQRYPQGFKTNFLLINAKNANAMTGEKGIDDINELFEEFGKFAPKMVNPIMSSTGVIGYRLPKDTILDGGKKFDFFARDADSISKAIMTTDRFSKTIAFRVELGDGKIFNIGAICKGAGMINPQMATMLCFILTDADIPKNDMKAVLQEAADKSFNAVSVDGDTSTNDSLIMMTSRKSGIYDKTAFSIALQKALEFLALELVRDGEGSTKVVAFEVSGAANDAQAQKAAKALSNSLLVKTAIFGEDPNWGRIASTIGASGVDCDEKTLTIRYEDMLIYSDGVGHLNAQNEPKAAAIMKKPSYKISCDLGIGDGKYVAYGCDLGYEYVKINADYRT